MFYTVYKITNIINEKIYIGVHKTKNIDDDYMGSGKVLQQAQNKYGIENFEKEILEVFDNPEEMFEMESKLVTTDFVKRYETYNLKEGGIGGWGHLTDEQLLISRRKGAKVTNEIVRNRWKYDKAFREKMLKIVIENGKKAFKGKSHNEETKKKIGEANSKHQKGKGNSQYGTMWIHSLKEKRSKKIKKEDLSKWESKGWIKGRKMKFF